jgi:hypothetical protein
VQGESLALVDRTRRDGRLELRLGDRPRDLTQARHRDVALGGDLGERAGAEARLELGRGETERQRDTGVEGAAHAPHPERSG